ncbi:hypothetical protein NN561_010128 [Cricetulus griseus]
MLRVLCLQVPGSGPGVRNEGRLDHRLGAAPSPLDVGTWDLEQGRLRGVSGGRGSPERQGLADCREQGWWKVLENELRQLCLPQCARPQLRVQPHGRAVVQRVSPASGGGGCRRGCRPWLCVALSPGLGQSRD